METGGYTVLSVLTNQADNSSDVQPQHKTGGYLRQSLEELRRQAEAQNALPPPAPQLMGTANLSAHDTYHAAIAVWLTTLTPGQRQRKYAIREIADLAHLTGEGEKRASVQSLGTALHENGFKPARDWTKAGRNRRWWQLI